MNYSAIFSSPGTSSSSTLHSASVGVSDFSKPRPSGSTSGSVHSAKEDGRLAIAQDYLTPLKLVQLSGEPNLSRVTVLQLSVDTTENSLGNFGSYLPNLAELRFTESVIPCVRDLGTSLPDVRILWMTSCMLKDLDGLPALPSLKELYLAFNNVADVSVITMLSSLEVLDLERNNLSDKDQLGYLGLCSLSVLTLEGNPLSITLAEEMGSESGYRAAVHEAIPSIKVLDDVVFAEEEGGREWGEEVKEDEDNLLSGSSVFMLSDAGMQQDWQVLQSSTSPLEEQDVRPRTAPSRSCSRMSASPTTPTLTSDDEGSLNQVICGNPLRALRAHRQHGLRRQSALGTCRCPTTTTHPCRHRPHAWELDPVFEDTVITTRVKSEENLFVEEVEAWQLYRLSSSTNTYNRPLSPSLHSTSPTTSLFCSLPSLFQPSPPSSSFHPFPPPSTLNPSPPTFSPGPTPPSSSVCPSPSTSSLSPTLQTALLGPSPPASLHLPPIPLHPTPPKTPPAPPDNPHHQSKSLTDYRRKRYRKNWTPPSSHPTSPSQDPNTRSQ